MNVKFFVVEAGSWLPVVLSRTDGACASVSHEIRDILISSIVHISARKASLEYDAVVVIRE